MAQVTANRSGYLPTLDGWRALAIGGVIICHLTYGVPMKPKLAILMSGLGDKGVELFFGISGFLITSRLLEEYRKRGQISLRGFYVRRALRILPPAFLYLAVIAVLGALGVIATSTQGIVAAFLFARNYVGGDWYEGHFWSLAVEEHFYFIWPGILVLSGILRARWIAIGVILAVAAWRIYLWIPLGNYRGLPWFFYRTDTRLDALFCGALIAILLEEGSGRWGRWLRPSFAVPVLGISVALLIGFHGPMNSVARLGQAAILPLIICSTVLHPQSAISRLLEIPVLRWMGRLSYSLYLWQELFLGTGLRMWPVKVGACFLAASASYYWVERPAIRLGHAWAPPQTAGHADLEQARLGAVKAALPEAAPCPGSTTT